MNILVVATTRLCNDGLTAMLIRCAEAAAEVHKVDFALGESAETEIFAELKKIGDVYDLSSRKYGLTGYMKRLTNTVRQGAYEAVHIHGNSATMAFDLLAAKKGGARIRITHGHNCAKQPLIKQKTLGVLLNRLVTKPASCSMEAGKMLYNKEFAVIPNGIDCERFRFIPEKREKKRKELGLDECFVIGHLGRFTAQKNQGRLIRIFQSVKERNSEARLILIGEGEDRERCQQATRKLGIADDVMFVGQTKQPEDYYAAMDVLVMPSLFEGLPLAGVESQANGLSCVFSETITREADITGENYFVSLEAEDAVWAEIILKAKAGDRENAAALVRERGYDAEMIKEQVLKLYE